jgi:hypothetical protein
VCTVRPYDDGREEKGARKSRVLSSARRSDDSVAIASVVFRSRNFFPKKLLIPSEEEEEEEENIFLFQFQICRQEINGEEERRPTTKCVFEFPPTFDTTSASSSLLSGKNSLKNIF